MRTAVVSTPGGPEAIQIVDRPMPIPGEGQVLIRVEAATVNPVDAQTRAGTYHDLGWVTVPEVGLGWDVVGTVDALGLGVETVATGDRVAVLIGGVDRPYSAYAEWILASATDIAHVPSTLTSARAATIPLNATTAHQALNLFGPPDGRSLLITGAAGAVGNFAAEMAVRRGFAVTGLARPTDRDVVLNTGASFMDTVPAGLVFDAALDAAAIGDTIVASICDNGMYVGVVPPAVPAMTRGITTQAIMASADGPLLARLLDSASRGEISTRVHSLLLLNDAPEAHRLMEAGGLRGRIVLVPNL
ncbi:NADP-dependent oxidoreductase [Cryobacterium fucosi]|nr:NADP-dependent oxidoreductase [Cryobacterium fucosi]